MASYSHAESALQAQETGRLAMSFCKGDRCLCQLVAILVVTIQGQQAGGMNPSTGHNSKFDLQKVNYASVRIVFKFLLYRFDVFHDVLFHGFLSRHEGSIVIGDRVTNLEGQHLQGQSFDSTQDYFSYCKSIMLWWSSSFENLRCHLRPCYQALIRCTENHQKF